MVLYDFAISVPGLLGPPDASEAGPEAFPCDHSNIIYHLSRGEGFLALSGAALLPCLGGRARHPGPPWLNAHPLDEEFIPAQPLPEIRGRVRPLGKTHRGKAFPLGNENCRMVAFEQCSES